MYETIIGEFPEEAEAYWGLVLCKYGIEYVDDPATAKKIPTCHRSSFDSVMGDENLELAMEYADAVAKRMYREEAKQIEEIRRGILEVSSKEEPYDVFICYKETDESGERTLDSVLAQDIYNELTEKGYRVFFSRITLEDKLGQEYEPYIFAALHSARVMLAVGTSYEHYDAVWVKNEWSRYLQLMAAGEKKTLIPCYKDLDAYDMPKEFAKLQAQDLGKVGAMQDLVRGVEKILGKKGEPNASAADTAAASGMAVLNAQTAALLKRGYMALEDRQFDKAAEFFDQVLNNDAECGQAYREKVFASCNVCTVNDFIKNLWDRLERGERGEKISLTVNLSELAREADALTQMLSDFTDEELEKLMENEFGKISLSYDDCRAYYEKYLPFSLTDLVQSPSFKHAVQYADAEFTQEISQICENLTDKLQQRIHVERQNFFTVEKKLESKKKEIKETVKKWLDEANRAIEKDYEKRLDEWKQAKAA
ncbi:MAG TPA: toll/interleukin-1 receptor domain-containing protein, partial [Candidatus Lachnoclostridium stercoravium]|nr:toll/interleukin-1 receptor domain-containing protein [Candidatus Lachnoclostridium stercoravium]